MARFEKTKVTHQEGEEKRTLGEGVFRRCNGCGYTCHSDHYVTNSEVCPKCGYHYRLSGEEWIELLLDPDSFKEEDAGLSPVDALGFVDSKPYGDRIKAAQKKSGVKDAIMVGSGLLEERSIQIGAFLFRYMGGSMGSVVGEKITRMVERGVDKKQPVVLLSSSGGARMQEGVLSLMQMAKTVSALGRLREVKMPFVSVLLDPTTGGVAASFAFLGDVNIAEPNALIGFAGQRVIETTIRQKLPDGFQRAEFLKEHGMIDIIASRHEMRDTIARVLRHLLD
ncbi:MAG: acetyl-CoA carboxylase carboxyltransferase subunit beta [Myxococcales bacterium]|nr:MAG: acetyl-CoA carboxylase carboxyltransferase subunit beta [Myxococcales bacterium]